MELSYPYFRVFFIVKSLKAKLIREDPGVKCSRTNLDALGFLPFSPSSKSLLISRSNVDSLLKLFEMGVPGL